MWSSYQSLTIRAFFLLYRNALICHYYRSTILYEQMNENWSTLDFLTYWTQTDCFFFMRTVAVSFDRFTSDDVSSITVINVCVWDKLRKPDCLVKVICSFRTFFCIFSLRIIWFDVLLNLSSIEIVDGLNSKRLCVFTIHDVILLLLFFYVFCSRWIEFSTIEI